MKLFFLAGVLILVAASFVISASVDPRINAVLEMDEEVRVIILLKEAGGIQISEEAKIQAAQAKFTAMVSHDEFLSKHQYHGFKGVSGKLKKSAIEKIKNLPNVEAIVYDAPLQIDMSDTINLVNATRTWGLVYNGTNITGKYESVCVIDTGVNFSHVGMGNCTTDSFLAGNCSKVPSGYDFYNSDANPLDDHGHGTHVSGTIASTDSTYKGIAPEASIIAIKACDSSGSCDTSAVIAGIDWCVYNYTKFNISVISMSLGGGSYSSHCDSSEPVFRNAIEPAISKNISVIASTGNSGSTTSIASPSCVKNVTAVSSTTKVDAMSTIFANRNSITDLVAPGSSIVSLHYTGGTSTLSGTSMATPHVAGAFALIRQFMRITLNKTQTPAEIESLLNRTGKPIADSGTGLTFRRISVYDAISSLDTAPAIAFVSPSPPNNSVINSSSFIVNITSNISISSAILEWSGANYTMSQLPGNYFYFVKRGNQNGNDSFRIFAFNPVGNFSISAPVGLHINNTAPNVTTKTPGSSNLSSVNVSIAEPANTSFNLSAGDANSDSITITWYRNGSNQTLFFNLFNYSFLGNYSSSGSYNITAVVDDGSLSNSTTWILNISNNNRVPQWNFTPQNQSTSEDIEIRFNITAYDVDDDILYYSINDSGFTLNNTNGSITFTPPANISKFYSLNVSASDGFINISELINLSMTAVNDAPSIVQTANVTINETDWANFTIVASDIDSDSFNYSVNLSRLTQNSSGNFSFRSNLSDSGNHRISVNVTDGNLTSSIIVNITILDAIDTDSDGVPDIYDADDDSDGIADDGDYLRGNNSQLNTTNLNISDISVFINASSNLSQRFNGSIHVNVTNGSVSLVEFQWNFTLSTLSLNFTVDVEAPYSSYGGIIVKNLPLQSGEKKNVTVRALNSTIGSVCVKDSEVSSFSEVSARCNGASETLISCPGANSSYTCSLFNSSSNHSYFRIYGLSFSAAKQQCPDGDGDGYYVTGCGSGTDCNDNSDSISPGDTEVCGDGIDNDCSGGDAACPITSNSGGSGGGGGGGGGGSATATSKYPSKTNVFSSIAADVGNTMNIANPSIPVSKVYFSTERSLTSYTLTVSSASSIEIQPLATVPENLYQVVKIDPSTALDDSDFGFVTIEFSVNKSWISQTGVDKDKVKLLRLKGSTWIELPTTFVSDSTTNYKYASQSQGFSYFTIVSSKKTVPKPANSPTGSVVSNETEVATTGTSSSQEQELERVEQEEKELSTQKFQLPNLGVLPLLIIGGVALAAIIIVGAVSVIKGKSTESGIRPELEDYIRRNLARGKSRKQIRQDLVESGWLEAMVDDALKRI